MLMNSNESKMGKKGVQTHSDLAADMADILAGCERRLENMELTIQPVYHETEELQSRQQNLCTILNCLETVLSHYDVSEEVCNLVHQGPIEGNISVFLEALDRLHCAMEYFLHHNSQSVELENVTSLFNTGCEGLNNHYRLLLKKNGYPLKPVELLDLIYIEDDSSSSDDYTSFRQLAQPTREELNTISHWLEQNLRFEYTSIYSSERGSIVLRSLHNLKDYQKSNSWGNEAVKSRHAARPDTKKNTSARLQQIFERKANKLYLKATQTLEQSTGISIKKATSHSEHLGGEEFSEGGDQELDKYLVMLLGLQRLLNWERTLMHEIIPTSKHCDVFDKISYKSIDLVVKDVESITNRIMRSITRKEWTSALGIFSALKRVILLQPDIDRTYDMQQREQLTKVLNKLQYTGSKALEHFLEMVRGESTTNLVSMSSSTLGYVNVPKDATVHELTSNTIWFIEHLCDHYDVIGVILQPDILYSTQLDTILMKKQLPDEDRNKALLAIYIKKALAELNLSIMNKCEQYNDQATKHLFRLNNINYILNSLITSNLIDIVMMAEHDCRNSYIETIKELKCSYQKTWAKMLTSICPLDELPRTQSDGKIKDKDRGILKERFLTFNKDFEEACKIQRGISIPDVTLRQSIKRDNEEHILPKYNDFFRTYASVQFSKNPEKYVKYQPYEVKAMLNKLFDDSV